MRPVQTIPEQWADRLLALYPSRWRERYEEEFRAVLADCPLTITLIADVCRGAADAHLQFGRVAERAARQRQCDGGSDHATARNANEPAPVHDGSPSAK